MLALVVNDFPFVLDLLNTREGLCIVIASSHDVALSALVIKEELHRVEILSLGWHTLHVIVIILGKVVYNQEVLGHHEELVHVIVKCQKRLWTERWGSFELWDLDFNQC